MNLRFWIPIKLHGNKTFGYRRTKPNSFGYLLNYMVTKHLTYDECMTLGFGYLLNYMVTKHMSLLFRWLHRFGYLLNYMVTKPTPVNYSGDYSKNNN